MNVVCGQVANPIGAGDTCTGVMSYCMATGLYTPPEAFAAGLAAASASCLQDENASLNWATAATLLDEIIPVEQVFAVSV